MAKDNSERIDKFLRGLMTPEENDAFMSDFNSDKVLREETQITALMIKELEESQAQKDAEIIEEVLASKKKKAKIITIVRRTLSIAAMIILIFGVTTLWNRQSDTDALFEQYYVSPEVSSPRSADGDAVKQLEWEQKKTLPPLLIDYKPFMIILWQTMRNMMNTNIPRTQLIGILLWLT